MSTRILILSVILMLLPMSSAAQVFPDPEPGSLLVGYIGPTIPYPPYFELCGYPTGCPTYEFWVWAVWPEEPVDALEFEVRLADINEAVTIIESREILLEGAVDSSAPDDDVWLLDLGGCVDRTPGEFVQLLHYSVWNALCETGSVCLTSPPDMSATWTMCSGSSEEAAVYPPAGLSYPEGCFVMSPGRNCPVRSGPSSWSSLKSRF